MISNYLMKLWSERWKEINIKSNYTIWKDFAFIHFIWLKLHQQRTNIKNKWDKSSSNIADWERRKNIKQPFWWWLLFTLDILTMSKNHSFCCHMRLFCRLSVLLKLILLDGFRQYTLSISFNRSFFSSFKTICLVSFYLQTSTHDTHSGWKWKKEIIVGILF